MDGFQFLRPLWLLALPASLLGVWAWYRLPRRAGRWAEVCDAGLLPHVLLLSGDGGRDRRAPAILLAVLSLLASLALAGPAWVKESRPVMADRTALVIALDLSRSMDATDVLPSRVERAKHKILDMLDRRPGGRTGLVVYANKAFPVTPLTDDSVTIRALVPALRTSIMPAQGGDTEAALTLAEDLLKQGGSPDGRILLISDGVDGDGAAAKAADLARKGIATSVLAVGTAEGAPVPMEQGGFLKDRNGQLVLAQAALDDLRRLADSGGGRFATLALDDRDLAVLLPDPEGVGLSTRTESTSRTVDTWRDEGPWLVLLALPLAALAFRRGWVAGLVIVLLPLAPPRADAVDWQSLWLRDDQRAYRAMSESRFEDAAALFDDPAWRAAAEYRRGEYAGAEQALTGLSGPDAAYNLGNALARQGRLEEAIAAYEQALATAPDAEDARHNRDLLKDLLQQQNSDSQGGDSQPQDQEGEGEQSPQAGGPEDDQAGDDASAPTPPEPQGASSQEDRQEQGEPEQARSESDDSEARADPQATQGERAETETESDARGEVEESSESDEVARNTEQWLRRIPDDPAELLRRKFRHQYRQLYGEQTESDQTW